MTIRYCIGSSIVTIVALVALSGCGKQQTTAGSPTAKAPSPGTTAPAASATLGARQDAGPFEVTLTPDPEPPRVGKAHFMAMVMKNGQHAKGAKVRLTPSMPSMAGSEVRMEPMGNEYGATIDLSMPGDWTAKIDISKGGDSGTAEYRFTVSK